MRQKIDLVGQVYGRLIVIKEVKPYINPKNRKYLKWLCQCECGNTTEVVGNELKHGKTKSCGCYYKEAISSRNTTHGYYSLGKMSSEYRCWLNMKERCLNPNNKDYIYYGGRDIKVCDRWLNSFENFYSDIGPRPKGNSIERLNNDGNYEPSNCIWADKTTQARNQRTTVLNKDLVRELRRLKQSHTYKQLSEMFGINKNTIQQAVSGTTWKDVN